MCGVRLGWRGGWDQLMQSFENPTKGRAPGSYSGCPTSFVTLDKLLILSGPWFSHVYSEDDSTYSYVVYKN